MDRITMDRIQEIYESYGDITQKIGFDKVQKRFMDLNQAYVDFIKENDIADKVKINSFMLIHAIMDYFTDISRLKEFHKIDFTNSYKTMAYEISWLLRRKPIQVLEDQKEDLVYINEKFILSYAINFITSCKESVRYQDLKKARQKCFNGFIESFYYHLKYRNCCAQSLELALLSFEAGLCINPNMNIKK